MIYFKGTTSSFQKSVSTRRSWKNLLLLPVCIGLLAATPAIAQNDDSDDELWTSSNDRELDELLHKILEEDDGDDEVPTKVRAPKVHSKLLTTYGAKQALRWKINKTAFLEGYVDQGIGALDSPYKPPTSKFAGGILGNYLLGGFTITGGLDLKRNYSDVYADWDGLLDRTFNLGVSRKFNLTKDLAFAPSLRQSSVRSDKSSKDLSKLDLSLPLSYALDKQWTLKVLTVGISSQTYTNRAQEQTDKTWSYSTGLAYKWSEKSSFDVTLSREDRYSNQSSAEYTRTTIMPKYEYKISPTSSLGIAIGYETHVNNTEEFSRWLIVPKIQLRIDI